MNTPTETTKLNRYQIYDAVLKATTAEFKKRKAQADAIAKKAYDDLRAWKKTEYTAKRAEASKIFKESKVVHATKTKKSAEVKSEALPTGTLETPVI